MWGTRSLEMHGDLSNQIYHPRAILPLGNMTPALLDVALKIGVLVLTIMFFTLRDGRLYIRTDAALLWALAALVLAFCAVNFLFHFDLGRSGARCSICTQPTPFCLAFC